VPVVYELPDELGGEPVVVVPVGDSGCVVRDPDAAQEPTPLLGAEQVAAYLVAKLGALVEAHRALDVAFPVGGGVHVHFDEAHVRILSVFGDPISRHQNFGMGVSGLGGWLLVGMK
jgi:hypothetical protein